MRIDGRRRFKYNGRKYQIMNLPKADMEGKKKYYIAFVVEGGFYKVAYNNICWNMEKFETIKEAQIYVRNWDFLLDTLY